MRLSGIILSACLIFLSISCSLDYADKNDASSSSPDFVFNNVSFMRTEDNKTTVKTEALQLEQYDEGAGMYAEGVSFTLYDSSENPHVIGSCNLLSADSENDIYYLLGNIHIISYEHDAEIVADNLRWLANEEMFASGVHDAVNITIGAIGEQAESEANTRLHIEGTGFFASGLDFSYSFTGPVKGSIIQE